MKLQFSIIIFKKFPLHDETLIHNAPINDLPHFPPHAGNTRDLGGGLLPKLRGVYPSLTALSLRAHEIYVGIHPINYPRGRVITFTMR